MRRDERVTDAMVKRAASAFSGSCAVYPDGSASTPISDWFKLDSQDAVDFGVLKQPKWDGHSQIRGLEQEDYIAAVIMQPMRAALSAALSEQTLPVRVEALQFNDDPCPSAECIFGHYVINPFYAHVELLVGYGRMSSMSSLGRVQLNQGSSLEDLRAAAQQDYETRIRSALSKEPGE